MTVAEEPAVVVAMLTYLRPDDLPVAVDAVLAETEHLAGRRHAGPAGHAAGSGPQLLVVDNDPAASAMALAGRWPAERVRFVHEATPGIAAARNRALDEAGPVDAVVFVDDDERPQPGWLAALVATWRRTGAAAVAGPVVSAYPTEPEPWIEAGGFFRRRRLPTGTEITVAATNNLLLDLRQVRALAVRFDPAFGASGGSDTLFTRQLHRRGGTLVWCDEAVVVDVVPPARLTRRWVLRRALRLGNSWSRVALALEGRRAARARQRLGLTAGGLARMAGGGARLAAGVVTRSLEHRARGARTLARGLGMASGAWGYTYAEYRRPAPAR